MTAKSDEKRSTPFGVDIPMSVGTSVRTGGYRSAESFDLDLKALAPDRSKDAVLERRIKEGASGIDLLEFAKSIYDTDDATATAKIHAVIKESSEAITKTFSQDQVIVMAFHLYETALKGGRIKDAAMVLQSISVMLRSKGLLMPDKSEQEASLEVRVLEYLPES